MKNLITTNTIKLAAYLSLVFFAFINPYLLEQIIHMIQVFIAQQINSGTF